MTAAYMLALSAILALVTYTPSEGLTGFSELLALVFFLPALASGFLTSPLADSLGGRFPFKRGMFLAFSALGAALPVLLVWRLVAILAPLAAPPLVEALLFAQGPSLWLRHMSLFGVSNPSHLRTLPASVLQPALATGALFPFFAFSPAALGLAVAFPLLGFLYTVFLLRLVDRPLKREFGTSGVSLVRPMLAHVQDRDPQATEKLESFFRGFAVPANLRVTLLSFFAGGVPKASLVLPTVHPGPFAALGASDLPRKLTERLEPTAGMVLVPHTPCNHDLDIPTSRDVERVASAASALLATLLPSARTGASPLVEPHPGSMARAQVLGDSTLVIVSQAPRPTDDIALAVADRIQGDFAGNPGHVLALIDAHNSYREGEGDVSYASPIAERLRADARAAVVAAEKAVVNAPIRVGVAARSGYSTQLHGIGPMGIRALVVEAAGKRAAYVLIDGNNLVVGMREQILAAVHDLCDAAEVMTTDNHVVHEVDGGLNPVGERYPVGSLTADVRSVVQAAIADRTEVEPRAGVVPIDNVPVLGPDWTARLLTGLGDTVSMFSNAFATSLLLLLVSSLLLLAATA